MPSVKNKDNQTIIWVIVAALVVITIGIIIYFVMKSKKENYIQADEDYEDFEENYEEEEAVNKYLVDSYVHKYIEEFELINTHVDNSHPLNENFQKVLHIANLISREPYLDNIRHEADRIGLHSDVSRRILKDRNSADKFSHTVQIQLGKQNNTIGQILKTVAPETISEIANHSDSPKIEKYLDGETTIIPLTKIIHKNNKKINRLKNAMVNHFRSGRPGALSQNPEVKSLARQARVLPETLEKIASSREELEKFIQGETTLEHYDPELYIENWNPFKASSWRQVGRAISNTAQQVGRGIVNVAKSAGAAISNVAAQIKTGVVNAANAVAQGATHAFEVVKSNVVNGVNAAIQGVVNIANKIAEFGEQAWNEIKRIASEAGTRVIEFVKAQFSNFVSQFYRQPDANNKSFFQINSSRARAYILNEMINIALNTILPGMKWLLDIPIIGPKVREELRSLIGQIFDPVVWVHVKPLVSDLVSQLVRQIPGVPANVNIQFAEWFEIKDILEHFEGEVKREEFENNWRNHIRDCIKKINRDSIDIPVNNYMVRKNIGEDRNYMVRKHIGEHRPCMTRSNLCDVRNKSSRHLSLEEKRQRVHELLERVIGRKYHLNEIVDEIVKITS